MSVDHSSLLRQQIESSLQKASSQKAKIQTTETRYKLSNTLFSAASTAVAGLATLSGQPLMAGGDEGWRLTCGIAALLALGATVVSGIQQNLGSSELLGEASACVAKLRALQVETLNPNYNTDLVRKEYQKILSLYPRVDC